MRIYEPVLVDQIQEKIIDAPMERISLGQQDSADIQKLGPPVNETWEIELCGIETQNSGVAASRDAYVYFRDANGALNKQYIFSSVAGNLVTAWLQYGLGHDNWDNALGTFGKTATLPVRSLDNPCEIWAQVTNNQVGDKIHLFLVVRKRVKL